MQSEDWESSALYLDVQASYDEKVAIEKVRKKLEELRNKCDLYFFPGHHEKASSQASVHNYRAVLPKAGGGLILFF